MTVEADARIANPIPVEVKNWAPQIKPPVVKKTTLRTYVLDPAGLIGVGKFVQIADYEPQRLRMVLIVADVPVALTYDPPSTTPDVASAPGVAPQGALLPVNANGAPYEFFGTDAFWLNSLVGTVGRVTVIKEFC